MDNASFCYSNELVRPVIFRWRNAWGADQEMLVHLALYRAALGAFFYRHYRLETGLATVKPVEKSPESQEARLHNLAIGSALIGWHLNALISNALWPFRKPPQRRQTSTRRWAFC